MSALATKSKLANISNLIFIASAPSYSQPQRAAVRLFSLLSSSESPRRVEHPAKLFHSQRANDSASMYRIIIALQLAGITCGYPASDNVIPFIETGDFNLSLTSRD